MNTRGLHITEGTIDPKWGAGVPPDIAVTMHPGQLERRNVLGTLLVEPREAVSKNDPTTTADVAARPTIAPMDHSATQRVPPPPPSDAPMDQTNSQPALFAADNSTIHPMPQPITQSAPSVPGTTNPPLGPESVKSTAHAVPTPNLPALERVTTQAASSVDRMAENPPLVSDTSQYVPPIKESLANTPIATTTTGSVPQTESLSDHQPQDPTSPFSNSTIFALPDGGSDKDTAIILQQKHTPRRSTHLLA